MLLAEGIGRLEPLAAVCQQVDVAALRTEASAARERLLALGPTRMSEFDLAVAPQIRLTN